MQFELHKASNGQWYWLIRASNGKVLATSETYWNREDAISAGNTVIAQAGGATFYDMAA